MTSTINRRQEQAWDGDEGAYWARHHELFEGSLARYQPAFLAAAAIGPGHRVLDVGCGTGVTTRDAAAAAPAGHALGVDLSSAMIGVARELAGRAGLENISFERADAQAYPFRPESFDVLISRTGSMFFEGPKAAFANLRRALAPGGRMALLTWRQPEEQEWINEFARALTGRELPASVPAGPGPFSLSDPDEVRALLGETGFAGVELTATSEPMVYGRTVGEAHAFLLGLLSWMLPGQDEEQRAASAEELQRVLAEHATPAGVCFGSSAWLITAQAG
ncbi:methyltransferase domain-containing protein [Actinoplanes missouriensis]|uniref:class I SAM-dependent methyltransferase n=1 Tax=Actinoplanes missouriensis TaxID=1866 RepID=UPI0033D1157C